MSYRLRFQERLEFESELDLKHTLRNRLALEYDSGGALRPGLTVEQYTVVGGGKGSVQERRRVTASVEVQPAKAHSLEIVLRREQPLEDATDPIERILGLDYQYRVPRK